MSAAHVGTGANRLFIKILSDSQVRFSDTRIVGREARAMRAPLGKPMHGRGLLALVCPRLLPKDRLPVYEEA